MLKGIDPVLGPDLLHVLRAMGHGDEVALVDANFPGTSTGQRIVRVDGTPVTRVLEAVLRLLPLDDFVETPVARMRVVGDPGAVPDVCSEIAAIVAAAAPGVEVAAIERFDFYERARRAYAVVQTGELRLYGCILLTKGIIRPEGVV